MPRLFTHDVAGLVGYLRQVFDAQAELRTDRPVDVRIGDSIIMISAGGGVREALAGFFYVYVSDLDAVYAKAISAGAVSLEAPTDTPYGDRRATVRDPWHNTWQIARYGGV